MLTPMYRGTLVSAWYWWLNSDFKLNHWTLSCSPRTTSIHQKFSYLWSIRISCRSLVCVYTFKLLIVGSAGSDLRFLNTMVICPIYYDRNLAWLSGYNTRMWKSNRMMMMLIFRARLEAASRKAIGHRYTYRVVDPELVPNYKLCINGQFHIYIIYVCKIQWPRSPIYCHITSRSPFCHILLWHSMS